MSLTYTLEDLNPEQKESLLAYVTKKGRYWKSHLRAAWEDGSDANERNGHHLRQIRNTLGPLWLIKVKLSN